MMQKRRIRFSKSLDWWDVVVAGIASWVIGKILDKVNSEIQRRIKEGQVSRGFSPWQMIFQNAFLPLYFSTLHLLSGDSDDVSDPFFGLFLKPLYSGQVKDILITHKRLHELYHLKTDICRARAKTEFCLPKSEVKANIPFSLYPSFFKGCVLIEGEVILR
jgi:hypothetical protein